MAEEAPAAPPSPPAAPPPAELAPGDGASALDDLFQGAGWRGALADLVRWLETSVFTRDALLALALIAAALFAGALLSRPIRGLVGRIPARHIPGAALTRLLAAVRILMAPILSLLFLQIAAGILTGLGQPSRLVEAASSLLTAWVVIRLVTLVIRSPLWSRMAFFLAWPVAALDILGLLGPIVRRLDALAIPLGENASLSALDVVRGFIAFLALFWVASTLGKFLERRIYQIDELTPSLQVLIVRILHVLMPVLAFVAALQLIGVNLAALAVFSGAVGLGIGLGLQRSIANLVAGLTLILDKSIKPGDVVKVADTFGWVTSLGARYVAIRTRDGTSHLLPNEHFITNGVENWSHGDKLVRLRIPVGVSYGSDPHRVIGLCVAAAASVERVLAAPGPLCHLVAFGDSSIDFELRVWIEDPENGVTNVKGRVLLAVWDAFRENGVEIPFPQRDLHLKSAPPLAELFARREAAGEGGASRAPGAA
ncbi:MAG: mechanosensitive ion channel [Alphaproteobacteria bacterium]|nr:mechanosensitive ion channel [Alphaproteobacteria bacterium]